MGQFNAGGGSGGTIFIKLANIIRIKGNITANGGNSDLP